MLNCHTVTMRYAWILYRRSAEAYFNDLSPSQKNRFTYGALLNCYCKEKLADKAWAVFEKMDKMSWVSSLAFNNLMSLYMSLGQPEKVPPLVQDMKNRNIPLATFTFNIWMQCLSHLNDIDGVERVFEEMIRDSIVERDWTTYSNLAVVYVKAGLRDKAEAALKKLETEMGPLKRDAFHFLISLYAATSNLDEVHRIWKVLKSSFKFTSNRSYHTMLQALDRLKDIDGFQKCFEEWESSCSSYDIRLANTAVSAYIRFGKIEEAELVFHKAKKRSSGPFFIILDTFTTFHLKNRQKDLAMRYMEAAISEAEKNGLSASPESVDQFMTYFEEERDVDGAEKLCKSLKKISCFDNKTYGLLPQTYVAAKKTEPEMRKKIEDDVID